MLTNANRNVRQIVLFTFVSWLGLFIHNMADLPGLTLLSPENSIPTLTTLILFVAWWKLPNKRLILLVFFGWTFFLQFIVGGILSVLPFPFWPFNPPQTVFHYAMHSIYAVAQLPLIIVLLRQLRLNNENKMISGASA